VAYIDVFTTLNNPLCSLNTTNSLKEALQLLSTPVSH